MLFGKMVVYNTLLRLDSRYIVIDGLKKGGIFPPYDKGEECYLF